MAKRHRVKISATVDPELLAGVDTYLKQRGDCDRSKMLDEALWLWLAQEQHRAMEAQYEDPDVPEEELRQWNAILDANARMMLRRDRE
jgi:hypothetical protein